jgi:hypothetical protein
LAKPIARQIDFFSDAIDHSFTDEGTFMKALLLVRFFPNRSLAINNLSKIESQGTDFKIRQFQDRDEVIPEIIRNFEIPENIIAEAISGLDLKSDAWN